MSNHILKTEEGKRLLEDRDKQKHWKRWGPYLSERQWGTVREDYSSDGDAWGSFPFDHAQSRAYRWGEDGLGGISDNHQRLCFALALWNGKDSLLKERLFGLTNPQGNHGEDVKEYYFYLDSSPTHSYMKFLYKYPQLKFPYEQLVSENQKRSRSDPEYELLDTVLFDENKYFDVTVEYAKSNPEDILIKITIINQGPKEAEIFLLPSLWFRNTWSWNETDEKPSLIQKNRANSISEVEVSHPSLGRRWFYSENPENLLFTENETNFQRLYGINNNSLYTKDGINDYIVNSHQEAINPEKRGTKLAVLYKHTIKSKSNFVVRLRLTNQLLDLSDPTSVFGHGFEEIFEQRMRETDDYYNSFIPTSSDEDLKNIQRQAFAGMLWTKQYYHYIVQTWLKGDKDSKPPPERFHGRNSDWVHLYTDDILSMPDKWEYPWFASWDTAFHLIPLVMVDPEFAKKQLLLLTREWYMHPNGQIPAYEWNFEDVNPPVHAWAAWRIFRIETEMYGKKDRIFLERVFQKLLLNFTWWVNKKDRDGKSVFQGGFLGLDNIGVFDRSGRHLEEDIPYSSLDQADGTAWMGMYCLNMLRISLELAQENQAYEDIASKFFEHFLYIANAMNDVGLWDEEDGFYYDTIHFPNQEHQSLKVRSMVGLIPLFAVESIDRSLIENLPDFKRRMEWFIENRPDLAKNVICQSGESKQHIFSLVKKDQLTRILKRLLEQNEFLSQYGIRALSKYHQESPYVFQVGNHSHSVFYEPGESNSSMFGGNSNWRGPIWFPVNFLIIESLKKFSHYFRDSMKVECPTDSGNFLTLREVSLQISSRLSNIFKRNNSGKRPVYGQTDKFQLDSAWRNLILFYEYFHGEDGSGIGASHQTGWTGLIAILIQQLSENELKM
ncbi:glucosidase [Candidatus Heimdallarchaeota archaeon B3_Heim]|nr:MAG: glucosidase [Candidatus Heimdallarchaeota archaeon B3_Heim]